MLIHGFIEESEVNGPGKRAVVHFQGCRLACPECQNPKSHPMRAAGAECWSPAELALRIYEAWYRYGINGVTLSGGEPMHHANEIWKFFSCLNTKPEIRNLSYGMFTGYTEKELESGEYWWKRQHRFDGLYSKPADQKQERRMAWSLIRQRLDFAVLGRYNYLQPCADKPLCSSRNQELRLFSKRYSLADFRPLEAEYVIHPGGLVQVTGFPSLEEADSFQ